MTGSEGWLTTVASDVSGRDGLGWELAHQDRPGEVVWEVFREDGGPFPIFTAARPGGRSLHDAPIEAVTVAAVADLLAAGGLEDPSGWHTRNICAALTLASVTVIEWQGEEWAVESGPSDVPIAWAGPEDKRTPFDWLKCTTTTDAEATVTTYQDDAVFGLSFLPAHALRLPAGDAGILRPRRSVPLARGEISRVSVAFDTTVGGIAGPGLLTEVLIEGASSSALLIAAEAYSHEEWHLHDEAVAAVSDPAAADHLKWIPERRPWIAFVTNGTGS